MQIDEKLWAEEQDKVLVGFIHHLAYYRTLSEAYSDLQIKSELWTHTIDAHILRAVIDWCMVFGTDSGELHWKKVIVDKIAQSDFRNHLLRVLGFTNAQWKAFWSGVTDFRNKYAAHRYSPYPSIPVGTMDTALKVAITYDDWFRQSVDAVFDEPSLQERYDRLTRTSSEPLRQIVSLGPTLEQEYEGQVPPCE